MTEQEIALANAKGLETRRRRWEQRNEKKRLAALAAEEAARAARRADEAFMKEAVRHADKTVLSHAEITAIKRACKKEGDWRLEDCTLYVTLEPCPMCAGAIVQARIPRVVIGSMNAKAGCAGSVLNILKEPGFNHQVKLETGILGDEFSCLMKYFFKELRLR